MQQVSIRKKHVISRIQNHFERQLPAPRAQLLKALCEAFCGEVSIGSLEAAGDGALTDDLCGLLHFMMLRPPGESLIRVFDGKAFRHTLIEIVTDDCPQLVASLAMELQRQGIVVHQVVHPVVVVRRDEDGQLLSLGPGSSSEDGREAVLRFEIERQPDVECRQLLEKSLQRVLEDVKVVNSDRKVMRRRLDESIRDLAQVRGDIAYEESIAYLRWLNDGRFDFIGYAFYNLSTTDDGCCRLLLDNDSRLGILRYERHFPVDKKHIELSRYLSDLVLSDEPLILTQSTYHSPVGRAGHLDYLGVKQYDANGSVVGEHRFFGLYSACTYGTPIDDVPMLRHRIERLKTRFAVPEDSYRGQLLRQILMTYPRDEMLQTAPDELEEIVRGMLEAYDRPQLRLFARSDVYGRFVSALVLVPREKFNSALRRHLQQLLLEAFDGSDVDSQLCQLDGLLVTLHCRVHTADAHCLELDIDRLERGLSESMQSWDDRLLASLVARLGEAHGRDLHARFSPALSPGYCADVGPDEAVEDLLRLERLGDENNLEVALLRKASGTGAGMRFKLCGRGASPALSSVLPILENLGLRVLNAHPHLLGGVWILDFEIESVVLEANLSLLRDRFEEAFVRISCGDAENDGYNRLVTAAGLDWRQVLVLRALGRYLSQIRLPFAQRSLQQALLRNPGIAVQLCDLFAARFDPERQGEASEQLLREVLDDALDAVSSLEDDRILRAFQAVIFATLRTNHFASDTACLAFKLKPAAIPDMPKPLPAFEIFVYSPRVEGVHLRGGKVARGGLRWSDRRDDYRTEVLGLMKAQLVKNAVIVPTGSKGGFYCKQLPAGASREQLQQEAIDCYRVFIGGLLDLTDNIVDGVLAPPARVVRHDDDDPYLVVAADKGTATFSDIANGIAEARGFWLGDAFASGGANGYDHKKMGITARGAWESVKRLFREQGRNCQSEEFTVVGIGDMSGDVFGNGMLLSRHIRLVAAFNHQHIFIDPDPDAERSFAERERLFRLPRSGWTDYDTALISCGGGVFSRSTKQIPVSEEMRRALGIEIEVASLTPSELIRHILCAPIDLLWNGGIGTYVKARDEGHVEVGDRANDDLRVDAADLRFRVVGEGGNLGFSQRGRIEFARNGGLINTDAIDNAGGVNCSDHEVNIKVLLSDALKKRQLSQEERNLLLAEMSDEVAALVLDSNYRQAALLSEEALAERPDTSGYRMLIQTLQHEARLDPALECLPEPEALLEAERIGAGLSRPEIAVLAAYAKIRLSEQLQAEKLADKPEFAMELARYFPSALQLRYPQLLAEHPLRHEILATQLAGELVNRMGVVFPLRCAEETGVDVINIVKAYLVAREWLGAESIWRAIDALDQRIPYKVQLKLSACLREMLEHACRALLARPEQLSDIDCLTQQLGSSCEQLEIGNDVELDVDTWGSEAVPAELEESLVGARLRLRALGITPAL